MNCATSATSATFFNSCKVPPELADRIIDFLHDDPASLRTCSLTCRSWVHSSRYHIFHFIELSALRHYIAFARLLKTAPCLGRYVRSMVIQMHPDLLHAHSQGMLLTDIACRLGDVRRLVIMGVSNPVDHETLAQFGPVSELTICSSFAHPSDVVALFAAFPAVQDVVFMSLKPRENGALQRSLTRVGRPAVAPLGGTHDVHNWCRWIQRVLRLPPTGRSVAAPASPAYKL
ncbi:hypothetical protein OBBRIDRAFT_628100 [Obba rivulosa]|uniref:F-box domain-containing protein n=1 Tax=Obba rivulosa TaxID=1052685 RepID=A0A8E2AT39_9APHY|nr:hypothetical protein OBBRIDRAFT_628100 [Obba rivulosa]